MTVNFSCFFQIISKGDSQNDLTKNLRTFRMVEVPKSTQKILFQEKTSSSVKVEFLFVKFLFYILKK